MDTEILNAVNSSVVSWFKKQGDKQTDRGSSWKLIMGVIVSVFAVIAVMYLKYKINNKNKELAKLKHEKDLAEEKEHALNLKRDIEEDVSKIKDLDTKLVELDNKIKDLDNSIRLGEKALDTETVKIHAIEKWEDMDRYIDNMRSVFGNQDSNSGRN